MAAGEGQTRTYYIAADEVVWDYAPSSTNLSEARPFNDVERPWMEPGAHFIGRKAKKALYRGYTDDTFSTLKPRPSEWEHLGFLGPLVRAEVGDTIRVVFRNNTKFPASVHPHGVFYGDSGAHYADRTADRDGGRGAAGWLRRMCGQCRSVRVPPSTRAVRHSGCITRITMRSATWPAA